MEPSNAKQFGYELTVNELTRSDVSFTCIFSNGAQVRRLKASYIVYLADSVPFLTTVKMTHDLASTAVGNGKGDRTAVVEFHTGNRHYETESTIRVVPSIYLIRSTRDESKGFTLLVETVLSHSDQLQTNVSLKDDNQINMMGVSSFLTMQLDFKLPSLIPTFKVSEANS